MSKSLTLVFLAATALAVSAGYIGHFDHHHGGEETKKDYNFDYTVHDPHSHNYHSHQESSSHGVVKGYYAVKEADGSLREVHYTADPKEGFKAIVTKNGVQVHPHVEGHHGDSAGHQDFGDHQDFGGHEDFGGHQDFGGHEDFGGHADFGGHEEFDGHEDFGGDHNHY